MPHLHLQMRYVRIKIQQTAPTERFTDLGKQNSRWRFDFGLEPIFSTAPAASKNNAQFKRGQN